MTSLFNDNENIACESCGKVIMREMLFFDWELYCDVVEEVLNDIPRVCDTCAFRMLFRYYHGKYKKVKETVEEFCPTIDEHL